MFLGDFSDFICQGLSTTLSPHHCPSPPALSNTSKPWGVPPALNLCYWYSLSSNVHQGRKAAHVLSWQLQVPNPSLSNNPTPAELLDEISTHSMPSLDQLQHQHNNHAVGTVKIKIWFQGWLCVQHCMLQSQAEHKQKFLPRAWHSPAGKMWCINLWRSCYRFLRGHIAEISLLKSQVSFGLHIFPNTSWSLSPSVFQWTLIKMNLASRAFDLILFICSWASGSKKCNIKK